MPELKDSVTWLGNPREAVLSEDEWEAFHERMEQPLASTLEACFALAATHAKVEAFRKGLFADYPAIRGWL